MAARAAAAIVEGVAIGSITTGRRPRARRRPQRAAADPSPAAVVETAAPAVGRSGPGTRVTLEALAAAWCSALDAAEAAARAARTSLEAGELRTLTARLSRERSSTVALLEQVARAERVPARFTDLLVARSSLRSLPSTATPRAFTSTAVGSSELHAASARKRSRRWRALWAAKSSANGHEMLKRAGSAT